MADEHPSSTPAGAPQHPRRSGAPQGTRADAPAAGSSSMRGGRGDDVDDARAAISVVEVLVAALLGAGAGALVSVVIPLPVSWAQLFAAGTGAIVAAFFDRTLGSTSPVSRLSLAAICAGALVFGISSTAWVAILVFAFTRPGAHY